MGGLLLEVDLVVTLLEKRYMCGTIFDVSIFLFLFRFLGQLIKFIVRFLLFLHCKYMNKQLQIIISTKM